jgi:ABC-type branched-subunit amino acid transport system substrate-binding protein
LAASQGVGPGEIVLGVTSAFRGPSAALGTELYRGYAAYFAMVNDQGGVNGRRIRMVLRDDGYDPPRAVQNTINLIEQDRVFLLFGNVGTPTTVRVLPLLKKYEDRQIHLFSPFTGAQTHREEPYAGFVFNVRASYRDETEGIVRLLLEGGYRRIGVFYQSDAYGKSGQDGVERALAARGSAIAAEATYLRGTTFGASLREQAAILRAAEVDAVVSIGAYAACAAFIRDARDAGFTGPVANISFVGPEAMLALLRDLGQQTGRDYTAGLVNSQVVPFHGRSDLPGVGEYRRLLDRYSPQVPEELRDPAYKPARFSFGSLEGYLNARVLVEALRRLGGEVTGSRFREAMEGMGEYDLGLDVPVSFGPGDHQGLPRVYFTTVVGGEWAPLADIGSLGRPRREERR